MGMAIVNSPLFKCAIAGNDPNVGRLLGAIGGFLGERGLEPPQCTMRLGGIVVFESDEFRMSPEVEESLFEYLSEAGQSASGSVQEHERCVEVEVEIKGRGDGEATVYGSDLTQDYVTINTDYRS